MAVSQALKAVLIITGAWHVPEHYYKVTSRLTAKGVRVIRPLLPTNNNAVPPNKYLEDDIDTIRDIVAAEVTAGTQLTVLAHSWGGIVATAALGEFALTAERAAAGLGGVAAIVLMAAFVPFKDESLAAIFGGALPPYLTMHPDETLRWDDPIARLYNDLPADEARDAEGLRVHHSAKAQHTGIVCEQEAWRVIPVTYLLCELDAGLPVEYQQMMVERVKAEGVSVREVRVPAGHSAFLSKPDMVVQALQEAMVS